MSPGRTALEILVIGFPRVSGDEPVTVNGRAVVGVFSPRERG